MMKILVDLRLTELNLLVPSVDSYVAANFNSTAGRDKPTRKIRHKKFLLDGKEVIQEVRAFEGGLTPRAVWTVTILESSRAFLLSTQ
jgi:hypothetical protein